MSACFHGIVSHVSSHTLYWAFFSHPFSFLLYLTNLCLMLLLWQIFQQGSGFSAC